MSLQALARPQPFEPGGTDRIGPLLKAMLDLAVLGLDPKPGRAAVMPAMDLAWDDCCVGQLWVRLVNLTPYDLGAKMGGHPCRRMWVATVGVGVVRCVPALDQFGNAPTPEQLTDAALQVTADEAALCSVIQCEYPRLGLAQIQRWDPQGPEGGCAGGEWTVTMQTPTFDCTGP